MTESSSTAAEHRPAPDQDVPAARSRLLLITGMSGAGKTVTLKVLEDLGYEVVDNLPLSLVASLVGPPNGAKRPLAIGVDIRTRDFAVGRFQQEIDALAGRRDLEVSLVFLDCDDEILQQRYTETRRRHPMADDRRPAGGAKLDRRVSDGIRHERGLLLPLRDGADLVIDTTRLSVNDIRRILAGHFALDAETGFTVSVISFSYRRGVPREADLMFDVRFLANPHYESALRPLNGLDAEVGRFIAADPDFANYFSSLTDLLAPLLPRFRAEGKSYLTIAIGCTGGQHRSVYVAERLAAWLAARGERVNVSHREIQEASPPGGG